MKKYFILWLCLTMSGWGCNESVAPLNNEANQDFEAKNYSTALNKYRQVQEQEPGLAEPYYNAGNALYHQGNLEQAELQLKMALRHTEDEGLTQDTFYNQGNIYYQAGNYEAAAEAYKEALRLNSSDTEAKHNLELALRKLEEQQQQSQQQQQPMDQPDGSENQETQPKNQSEQSNQEQPDPTEGEGEQTQPNTEQAQKEEPQTGQPLVPQEFTEEQARQLLEAITQNTDTLQERIQRQQAPVEPQIGW